jgi:hypothetical protein
MNTSAPMTACISAADQLMVEATMQKYVLRIIALIVQKAIRAETQNEFLVRVALLSASGFSQSNDDMRWEDTKKRIAGSNGETNPQGKLISGNGVDFFQLELDFNEILAKALGLLRKHYDNSTMTCGTCNMPAVVLVSSANPEATFM